MFWSLKNCFILIKNGIGVSYLFLDYGVYLQEDFLFQF